MKVFLLISLLLSSFGAVASVKCDPEQIKGVQVKPNGEVVYTTQSGIRRGVGKFPANPGVQFMAQSLLLAVEKNLYVQAAYPDGFNCKTENAQAIAEWVYIQNANQ